MLRKPKLQKAVRQNCVDHAPPTITLILLSFNNNFQFVRTLLPCAVLISSILSLFSFLFHFPLDRLFLVCDISKPQPLKPGVSLGFLNVFFSLVNLLPSPPHCSLLPLPLPFPYQPNTNHYLCTFVLCCDSVS